MEALRYVEPILYDQQIELNEEMKIVFNEMCIRDSRHVHLNDEQAAEAGVKDGDWVSIKIDGDRGVILSLIHI